MAKRIFTDEEVDFIVDNWGTISVHQMKKKFSCTWDAVAKVGQIYNLPMPKSNDWTDEQENLLRLLSDKYDYQKIAKLMEKTDNAIYLKARRLRIVLIQNKRKWTKEEELYLKENWGKCSIDYLAKKMKRSIYSLKVKAIRMKLGPMLNANDEYLLITEVSEILNVSRERLSHWHELGLTFHKIIVSRKKYYYGLDLDELMDFLKNHQNLWDSRELEPYGLSSEPSWLCEKRRKDRIDKPEFYHKWTKEEILKVESLFNIGKNPDEIADYMNLSFYSVNRILKQLGYNYVSPIYWTDDEKEYLKENYKDLTYNQIAGYLNRPEGGVSEQARTLGLKKVINKVEK